MIYDGSEIPYFDEYYNGKSGNKYDATYGNIQNFNNNRNYLLNNEQLFIFDAKGYKVLFTTAPYIISKLKELRSLKTFRQIENQFLKYDLVICDELGYISFDKEGS